MERRGQRLLDRNAKPAWQTAATQCARKANADVSAVADPNTGVAVNVTFGGTGFTVFGGTSASSPIIAVGVRAGRRPGRRLLAGVVPVVAPGQPVRRGQRQQRHLHAGRALPAGRRLGRPDRSRHARTARPPSAAPAAPRRPRRGCTAGQLLGNPGFETGAATPWSATPAVVTNDPGEAAAHRHLEGLAGRLRDHPHRHAVPDGDRAERVHQRRVLLLPAHRQRGDHDHDGVRQADRQGRRDDARDVLQPEQGDRLHPAVVRATGAAGTSVTLSFSGTEDTSLQTSFVVDDAALTVS